MLGGGRPTNVYKQIVTENESSQFFNEKITTLNNLHIIHSAVY